MNEVKYGERKTLFAVVETPNGRIEVRVYHANRSQRAVIKAHNANSRFFIEHYDSYLRSKIRAKYWLARIVSDYRTYFESKRVDFSLRSLPE